MDGTQVGIGALGVMTLLVDLWAIFSAARRPAAAFEAAEKNKWLWIGLILVGIFVCNIGFFVSLWYLFMVDPQVKRMQHYPTIGFPGGTGNFPP
jgi:hypothetical protein